MTHKHLVVDTNILLGNQSVFKKFGDATVYLPFVVLQELDKHKTTPGDVGVNARATIRFLDNLREQGDLLKGVTDQDTTFKVVDDLSDFEGSNDDHIITIAKILSEANESLVLLSNDLNVRIKAAIKGVNTDSFKVVKHDLENDEFYTGLSNLIVDSNIIDEIYANGSSEHIDLSVYPSNHFLHLAGESNPRQTCVVRVEDDGIERIAKDARVMGISPKNLEQACALELLMDVDVSLVTITGLAGSGKTLLALAAALEQVINHKEYEKILIIRPPIPMGKDIGYLPGPQPLDAKIVTPDGWTTMGSLKEGSFVIGQDGKPTQVIGVFPKGKKDVYRVTTSDGTSTECCEDHLWFTQTQYEKKQGQKGSVRTLREIKSSHVKHYLPRNEAVEYNAKKLKLSAYTLGSNLTPNAFIPDIYKQASIKDRVSLIDGLMNGKQKNTITFKNKRLALDFIEIVRSLGGRTELNNSTQGSWSVNFNLPKKLNSIHANEEVVSGPEIISIELVGKKEVQCIRVDNKDSLYLTDDFIVTHNTLEDKMSAWMGPIQDNFEAILGQSRISLETLMGNGTIEIMPPTFIRGRSLANTMIIVDEAQGLNLHEVKTIATRVHESSKLVLTGDVRQIDNPFITMNDNGLSQIIEAFKSYGLAGHITLKKGERGTLASIAANIL